jgi:hypothetical protein
MIKSKAYPVLHWLAGEVPAGGEAVTVMVLVGSPWPPPGRATARTARVEKAARRANIVEWVWLREKSGS